MSAWGKFKERKVVLIYMNGGVEDNEIAGVVGTCGVHDVNKNGEHMMDICEEKVMF